MTKLPTFKCKLFSSTLTLNVSQLKDKGITASIWSRAHSLQLVFAVSENSNCRITTDVYGDDAAFWVDSTCFAIKRSDAEKLAKILEIRLDGGAA